jgi:AraC family transcriptional regulator of adaptative response / DNA-3-methyladenine glycosylase II
MSEILGLPDEAIERARRSRDPRFDGKFFVAVLSTGIYCRSICPVRMSRAVRYYATAAAAAEAGFRPCLRCRPEAAPGSPAWAGTSAVVRRALRLIQEGELDRGSVEELATRVGVGARHLNRLLVAQVGASPITIAQTRRLHFAKQLLDDTALPITEIALAAGYGSVRRFNGAFKATYKRTPQEIRRRSRIGPADEIRLRLSYRPPFDWPHLLAALARDAVGGVECVEANFYARTVRTRSGHVVVQISPCADANALEIRIAGAAPADLFELSSAARRVFDLSADPEEIARALSQDSMLAPLVAERPGLRIPGVWDPLECAMRAILRNGVGERQVPSIADRVVAVAGTPIEPVQGLTHLFPSVGDLVAADLAGLGLSPWQDSALRALARACEGVGPSAAGAEDALRAFARAPEIGPGIAQHVALRGLADPDAFPSDDPVLRRQAAPRGSPLTARTLEARAEVWRPWRGYAAIHLWTAAAQSKEAESAGGRT